MTGFLKAAFLSRKHGFWGKVKAAPAKRGLELLVVNIISCAQSVLALMHMKGPFPYPPWGWLGYGFLNVVLVAVLVK